MKWFKHDSDASIDAKLQILLLDYGAKGYGLYWYCVELIAQGVNENNITFELEHDARIIARNLNLSVQETKDMMEKMIELKLFSISQNHKLACYALAKRLDQSMTSNEKMRKLIADIKENHDAVMTQSIPTIDKVMQEEKRIEEIREEENRVEEIKDFDRFWEAYPKKEGKGQAEKAWSKASKSKDFPKIDFILSAIDRYKQTDKVQKGFIKNPSTWINGKCWLDEFTTQPNCWADEVIDATAEN